MNTGCRRKSNLVLVTNAFLLIFMPDIDKSGHVAFALSVRISVCLQKNLNIGHFEC